MKLDLRVAIGATAALAISVGCSNGNGIFGHDLPAGNITIADAVSGKQLVTSLAAPFVTTDLRFSIAISEDRFNGPYTVAIIKQQSIPTAANGGNAYPFAFNTPCFVPHQTPDTSAHANVITFSGDNANGNPAAYPNGAALVAPTPMPGSSAPPAMATPLPGGNPCHSGELETAEISDQKGHSSLFYYLQP